MHRCAVLGTAQRKASPQAAARGLEQKWNLLLCEQYMTFVQDLLHESLRVSYGITEYL
jgi:hypothetical protein